MPSYRWILIFGFLFISAMAQAHVICPRALQDESEITARFQRDYGVKYLPHAVLDSQLPKLVLNRIHQASEAANVSFARYLSRNHYKNEEQAQAAALGLMFSPDFPIVQNGHLNPRITPNLLRAAYAANLSVNDEPDVTIRFVPEIQGHGVFAARDFKKGEFIGEYAGITKVVDNIKDLGNMYLLETGFTYSRRPVSTDGMLNGNFGRFLNHSPLPVGAVNGVNAVFSNIVYQGRPVTLIYSATAIKQGSQILIDYGDDYWKGLGITPNAF